MLHDDDDGRWHVRTRSARRGLRGVRLLQLPGGAVLAPRVPPGADAGGLLRRLPLRGPLLRVRLVGRALLAPGPQLLPPRGPAGQPHHQHRDGPQLHQPGLRQLERNHIRHQPPERVRRRVELPEAPRRRRPRAPASAGIPARKQVPPAPAGSGGRVPSARRPGEPSGVVHGVPAPAEVQGGRAGGGGVEQTEAAPPHSRPELAAAEPADASDVQVDAGEEERS